MEKLGTIEIPNALNSEFDQAAFDSRTRRVFIAHTARDCIEVIDHDARKYVATLPGFSGVAGAVADDGEILATNRGSASVAWVDATTYETKAVFKWPAAERGRDRQARRHRDRRLHRRRPNRPDVACHQPEARQPAHDRSARPAALVRHR